MHGPIGTDRLDALFGFLAYRISQLFSSKELKVADFMPQWEQQSGTDSTLEARISALPGGTAEVPDWAKS